MESVLDAILDFKNFSPVISPSTATAGSSREERISSFNERADAKRRGKQGYSWTHDYIRKPPSQTKKSIDSLFPMPLSDLEVGKTHRGFVVYCRIATKVMVMNSTMCLVEDESKESLFDLAVYNLVDPSVLREGRKLAILEPFFKTRNDGTLGIRVDNPETDIIFDVEDPKRDNIPNQGVQQLDQTMTVETRLRMIVASSPEVGVNKLYSRLLEEGYNIDKKRVRALKAALNREREPGTENDQSQCDKKNQAETTGKNVRPEPLIPVLSERCPEKHKVLFSKVIYNLKEKGNAAFASKNYEGAEAAYSQALEKSKKKAPGVGDQCDVEVPLWQLYGNRCAARLKLGKLDQAMHDAMSSHICAPADAIKPILRCAEVMAKMGKLEAMNHLLDSAMSSKDFARCENVIREKKESLQPTVIWRVGKNQQFRTISAAVALAPPGAEIVVDKGTYSEVLVLTKSVTIRSYKYETSEDEYAAIRSLESTGDEFLDCEINVRNNIGIICNCPGGVVCLIGFRIICNTSVNMNSHALVTVQGLLVVRSCVATSTGPVVVAEGAGTRVLIQSSAVVDGRQGGILVCDNSHITLQQVHCCRHAASGLELRNGGSATIEAGQFYSNGRQGITAWQNAGYLEVKDCAIHSQKQESGILVSEANAELDGCQIYGNGYSGIVAQQKGSILVTRTEIYANDQGILIQDTGTAKVEECKVHSNRANGIFVGYDHIGSAFIANNSVYNNLAMGILVGAKHSKVTLASNTEFGNKRLPPLALKGSLSLSDGRLASNREKYAKRITKNKTAIKDAIDDTESSMKFFEDSVKMSSNAKKFAKSYFEESPDAWDAYFRLCQCCKKAPGNDPFPKCSLCKVVSYCSRQCQKTHWKEHKPYCRPPSVKYPAFLDPTKSV